MMKWFCTWKKNIYHVNPFIHVLWSAPSYSVKWPSQRCLSTFWTNVRICKWIVQLVTLDRSAQITKFMNQSNVFYCLKRSSNNWRQPHSSIRQKSIKESVIKVFHHLSEKRLEAMPIATSKEYLIEMNFEDENIISQF